MHNKIVKLLLMLAIGLSLLFGAPGCANKIIVPAETSTLATAPAPKLPYMVVDTGQDKCYDDSREITCPQFGEAFYAQDAQHQGNVLPTKTMVMAPLPILIQG